MPVAVAGMTNSKELARTQMHIDWLDGDGKIGQSSRHTLVCVYVSMHAYVL
jgi:hypothetical protein